MASRSLSRGNNAQQHALHAAACSYHVCLHIAESDLLAKQVASDTFSPVYTVNNSIGPMPPQCTVCSIQTLCYNNNVMLCYVTFYDIAMLPSAPHTMYNVYIYIYTIVQFLVYLRLRGAYTYQRLVCVHTCICGNAVAAMASFLACRMEFLTSVTACTTEYSIAYLRIVYQVCPRALFSCMQGLCQHRSVVSQHD